jgi:hypothetical protein
MATGPTERVGTRLMFENERVRVWDLGLTPGESPPEHIHRLDDFYLAESGGLIRFDDPDRSEGYRDVQFQDDEVKFREAGPAGKVDRHLTTIGTERHRNGVVELKRRRRPPRGRRGSTAGPSSLRRRRGLSRPRRCGRRTGSRRGGFSRH